MLRRTGFCNFSHAERILSDVYTKMDVLSEYSKSAGLGNLHDWLYLFPCVCNHDQATEGWEFCLGVWHYLYFLGLLKLDISDSYNTELGTVCDHVSRSPEDIGSSDVHVLDVYSRICVGLLHSFQGTGTDYRLLITVAVVVVAVIVALTVLTVTILVLVVMVMTAVVVMLAFYF